MSAAGSADFAVLEHIVDANGLPVLDEPSSDSSLAQ